MLKDSSPLLPKDKKVKQAPPKNSRSDVQICKFYQNGRCNKKENESRFKHPKLCRKFNQFGPLINSNKGCNGECGFFHPIACRNSIKEI